MNNDEKFSEYIDKLIAKTKENNILWNQANPSTFAFIKKLNSAEMVTVIQKIKTNSSNESYHFNVTDSKTKQQIISKTLSRNELVNALTRGMAIPMPTNPGRDDTDQPFIKLKKLYETILMTRENSVYDILNKILED